MINDALVNFLPPGSNLSIVGAVGVGFASNVVDILGTGVGTAPQNIIGTRTLFGSDLGIGPYRPMVQSVVGTAFTNGTGTPSLNVQFQAAVDTGSGGGYQPGTWITLVETGPILVANLTAGAILGRFDLPPAFPVGTMPRYLRMFYSVLTATNFAAGTISSCVTTTERDDWAEKYAAKNFVVA